MSSRLIVQGEKGERNHIFSLLYAILTMFLIAQIDNSHLHVCNYSAIYTGLLIGDDQLGLILATSI